MVPSVFTFRGSQSSSRVSRNLYLSPVPTTLIFKKWVLFCTVFKGIMMLMVLISDYLSTLQEIAVWKNIVLKMPLCVCVSKSILS